jgi:hypothetical protein
VFLRFQLTTQPTLDLAPFDLRGVIDKSHTR